MTQTLDATRLIVIVVHIAEYRITSCMTFRNPTRYHIHQRCISIVTQPPIAPCGRV